MKHAEWPGPTLMTAGARRNGSARGSNSQPEALISQLLNGNAALGHSPFFKLPMSVRTRSSSHADAAPVKCLGPLFVYFVFFVVHLRPQSQPFA